MVAIGGGVEGRGGRVVWRGLLGDWPRGLAGQWQRFSWQRGCGLPLAEHLHNERVGFRDLFSEGGGVFFLRLGFFGSARALGLALGVFLDLAHSLVELGNAVGQVDDGGRGGGSAGPCLRSGELRFMRLITQEGKCGTLRLALGCARGRPRGRQVVDRRYYVVPRRLRRAEELRLKANSVNRRGRRHLK